MPTEIESCERCDSKIMQDRLRYEDEQLHIFRYVGAREYETARVMLCSMCWDELWEWALGDDSPDRSDRADPVPLDKLAEGVDRQITDLKGVLEEIEAAKAD